MSSERKKKNRFHRWLAAFLILCMVWDVPMITETVQAAKKTTTTYKNKWVESKKGFWYYYGATGEKATSLCTIKGKTYLFDSQGRERTGWWKVEDSYYYFRQHSGRYAYMATDTTINGIKLGSDGKAILDTTRAQRKVVVMCNAQSLVWDLTKNCRNKSRAYRLRLLYDYTQKNSVIKKSNIGGFHKTDSDWDLYYAERFFGTTSRPIKGDCYTYASIFGYMANALGYKVTICSTGHHGFVRIGNKFYDPSWQKAMKDNADLFAQDWDAVCPRLKIRYRKRMKYKVTI